MRKQIVVLVIIAMISIALASCDDDITYTSSNYLSGDFSIPVWDYADNFYFVDTLYNRSFREWQEGIASGFLDSNRIINYYDFEVWLQCETTISNKRFCVGKVMLGERPPQGYDTSITNPQIILGDKFAGYFGPLGIGEYYLNDTAGYIILNMPIPENYHVGVAYRNSVNKYYGKGSYNSLPDDTLILKLFKVANESPVTTPLAWKLKMKNVYRLPYNNLLPTSDINLMYLQNNAYINRIPGSNELLISMLKLDRFNNGTFLPPPDGKFDWIAGKTIYHTAGLIMFPILEPFGQGLQEAGVSSEYWFNEIYTEIKTQTQGNTKANMYKLMGTANYNNDK